MKLSNAYAGATSFQFLVLVLVEFKCNWFIRKQCNYSSIFSFIYGCYYYLSRPSGTNALNTDIVLKLSADGGSNYSTATLTAMPDFASGIKMAKVNDLSVTAGTSLKYKIRICKSSSATKEAKN